MNTEQIEGALIKLFSLKDARISHVPSDDYVQKSLGYLSEYGCDFGIADSGFSIPDPKVKLKDRIIMHKLVYTLGLIFFKKGSRLRNFLKKHI